jgi:hypothetical protein
MNVDIIELNIDKLSIEEKKEILNILVSKITIHKNRVII